MHSDSNRLEVVPGESILRMWSYILAFAAVAVFPLALAGYGGHLAGVALPESKARRKALLIVWGLATIGIALFGVFQIVSYRADQSRDKGDENFQTEVLNKLQLIINEPDTKKRKLDAATLKSKISAQNGVNPGTSTSPSKSLPTNSLPDESLGLMSNDEIRKEVRQLTDTLYQKASSYRDSRNYLDGLGMEGKAINVSARESELLNSFKADEGNQDLCARANYLKDIISARLGEPIDREKSFSVDDPFGILPQSYRLRVLAQRLPL